MNRPTVHDFACSPNEVVMSKDDPLAQEISDVLREWSSVWKEFYVVSYNHLHRNNLCKPTILLYHYQLSQYINIL